jgi:hypothetical protein
MRFTEGNAGAMEAEGRPKNCSGGEPRSKKRTYAQLHLELGQSDFVLHTCSVCRMMYGRGNDLSIKDHLSDISIHCNCWNLSYKRLGQSPLFRVGQKKKRLRLG